MPQTTRTDEIIDKYVEKDLKTLCEEELLEFILSPLYSDPSDLSFRLVERFGSVKNVLSADAKSLMSVDGMTASSAFLLTLYYGLHIKKELANPNLIKNINIPENYKRFFKTILQNCVVEELHAVYLNEKGKFISSVLVGRGHVAYVNFDLEPIVKEALLLNASFVILGHNHTSNNPNPSKEDIEMTKKTKRVLDGIGVRLIDHVITTSSCATGILTQVPSARTAEDIL